MSEPVSPQRARLLELLGVLAVVWLPFALESWLGLVVRQLTVERQAMYTVAALGGLCLIAYLVRRHGEPWSTLGFRRSRWWVEVAWAAVIVGLSWLLVYVVDFLVFFFRWPEATYEEPWQIPVAVPLYLLIFAAWEEILYRGYVWTRIEQLTGSRFWALLVSTTLFTATHDYGLRGLVDVFAFGLLYGALYWRGRRISRLILAHWGYNMSLQVLY